MGAGVAPEMRGERYSTPDSQAIQRGEAAYLPKHDEGIIPFLAIDHASLSRRSTVPTPHGDTSNIWAFNTLFP